MKISVYNNYDKEITFDYKKIIKDIKKYDSDKKISLILVDINKIAEINKTYRDKDYPTDVISFESELDEFDDDNKYAGDIFLCIDKVYEQAKLYGHSNEREFAFLLFHGVLHLHGYDHMIESDEKIMFAKQEEFLNSIGYTR